VASGERLGTPSVGGARVGGGAEGLSAQPFLLCCCFLIDV
jgi:hypothetical protein